MARTRKNGDNKMQAATVLVDENHAISVPELVKGMKDRFGLGITPKMASTYRYTIRKKLGLKINKRGRKRRGAGALVVAASIEAPKRLSGGLDELLLAGKKMGWRRVKEVVDLIIQAPDYRTL